MGQLITEWIFNTPARVTARKIHLNTRTVQLWYDRIRKGIWEHREDPFFDGPVEIDETYLGNKPKGIRGTGMIGKVPVFGMYDRKTKKVYAKIAEETHGGCLLPIILDHVALHATIYSDGFGAYARLTWLGYDHHVVYHDHFYSLGCGGSFKLYRVLLGIPPEPSCITKRTLSKALLFACRGGCFSL
jgi:transposase-like protein